MSEVVPKYMPIEPDWCRFSGMGRRTTYEKLGSGELKAIKIGSRTLIDVEHGLAWLRNRPPAVIRTPRVGQQQPASPSSGRPVLLRREG
jgi:hypothetical protein